MIDVSDYQANQSAVLRSRNPRARILIKELTTGIVIDTDISSFVDKFGSVTRRLSFDIGNFSPGSHSFTFNNTKDIGEFLFTFGINLGTEFWMDKQYELTFGFFDPSGVVTERIDRDFIQFYTGIIQSKVEDLKNGKITIKSKDLTQEVLDKNVCTLLAGTDVYLLEDGTDDGRGFQQLIKYGTHRLIKTLSDKSQPRKRENPFTAVVGEPNNARAKPIPGTVYPGPFLDPFYFFYFPVQNKITDVYGSADTLLDKKKIYYWDYRDGQEIWVAFANADLNVLGKSNTFEHPTKGGFYFELDSDTFVPSNQEWPALATWQEYTTGTGDWEPEDSEGNTQDDKIDPAVCADIEDDLADRNPVRIVDDLLTGTELTALADSTIDKSTADFTDIDQLFTFDNAFKFYDDEKSKINVHIDKQTSVFKIIQDIVKLTGMYFFVSAKKSSSVDQRIRLSLNTPINLCDPSTSLNVVRPTFSTKDRLDTCVLTTNNSTRFDGVVSTNFDPGQSTHKNFDIKKVGSGKKILQFAAASNPRVYWYDSTAGAQANVDRRFKQLSEPAQEYGISMGVEGYNLELADLIDIHEKISDQTKTVQLFQTVNNMNNGDIKIQARRYGLLYGPDVNDPTKLWAFVGCAYVDAGPDGETYHVF